MVRGLVYTRWFCLCSLETPGREQHCPWPSVPQLPRGVGEARWRTSPATPFQGSAKGAPCLQALTSCRPEPVKLSWAREDR